MNHLLVAGASGYLGRYVVQEFKNRGCKVRALVRNPEKIRHEGAHGEPAIDRIADEIFRGEATKPETIAGVCEGIDIVFSSLGMTRPDFVHSSFEVDYQANKNLLDLALKAKVKKFIYVSVLNADKMSDIANIQAHEQFVAELERSGIDYAVIRPTGFFSDMAQFLGMAKNGMMFLLGEGNCRLNPIHGADLAAVCADAVDSREKEVRVGGPETFTYKQIAEMAFEAMGKTPWYTPLPLWIVDGVAALTQFINRDIHDVAQFALAVSRMDSVAEAKGTHHLRDFFTEQLRRE